MAKTGGIARVTSAAAARLYRVLLCGPHGGPCRALRGGLLGGLAVLACAAANPARAESAAGCAGTDRVCLLSLLENEAQDITEDGWRDATYRETAKLLAQDGRTDDALALIAKVGNPDTKAMTIRGIGMAAAKNGMGGKARARLFARLRDEAAKIAHPPSHAIALTYIAMAQALAGDDAAAAATAGAMENPALRHKAFGETAEIQATRGDRAAAAASIAAIDDAAYRDKAGRTVSGIFAGEGHYDAALAIAQAIENPYQKAQAILHILQRQAASPQAVSPQVLSPQTLSPQTKPSGTASPQETPPPAAPSRTAPGDATAE